MSFAFQGFGFWGAYTETVELVDMAYVVGAVDVACIDANYAGSRSRRGSWAGS